MNPIRAGWIGLVGLGVLLAGCAAAAPTSAPDSAATPTSMSSAAAASSPMPSIQDVMKLDYFAPLEPGTYFIDPDGDPSTSLRVVYRIPAEGWSQWIGAAKFSDAGHAGLSITTVANLVREGCHDHAWEDPPVGPSVDDLVVALSGLAPFKVTSPASDVTFAGYRGKHLGWTVPDLPMAGAEGHRSFFECFDGNLKSWVAFIDTSEPGDAFYGYTGPGYREEFWILDIQGTRLMIAAEQSPGSPSKDLAERQAILDSVRIEP